MARAIWDILNCWHNNVIICGLFTKYVWSWTSSSFLSPLWYPRRVGLPSLQNAHLIQNQEIIINDTIYPSKLIWKNILLWKSSPVHRYTRLHSALWWSNQMKLTLSATSGNMGLWTHTLTDHWEVTIYF